MRLDRSSNRLIRLWIESPAVEVVPTLRLNDFASCNLVERVDCNASAFSTVLRSSLDKKRSRAIRFFKSMY